MMPGILVFLLLFTSFATAQHVYKTVDENGRVIYTDKPDGNNPEKIEVREPNLVPGIIPSPRPSQTTPSAPNKYQVTIINPAPETHLNPGTFNLAIDVTTQPTVHESHHLVILDNGAPVAGSVIEYIAPGSHQIQAQVLNRQGKVLGSSDTVMVYVHRARIRPQTKSD